MVRQADDGLSTPTLSGKQVGLRLPPQAARTKGPPRTRTARCINRTKRIRSACRSTPREGHPAVDTARPVHEATRRSLSTAMIQPSRTPRSHARVGMTLRPAASMGTGLISREARDVLSYRYATSSESSQTGYPTTKGPAQRGYSRSDGAPTLRIPIPIRRWSAPTAPDDDSPAFALVRAYVEPPAGIEPATPSLPCIPGPPPCYPAFPQVAVIRNRHSYGVAAVGLSRLSSPSASGRLPARAQVPG
jgi:hypothetical protein